MNKSILILTLSFALSLQAQDVSSFCQAIEEPDNVCTELLNLSADGAPCENCNDLAATFIQATGHQIPSGSIKELCDLPVVNPSDPEQVVNDQFCSNPQAVVCAESNKYALPIDPLLRSLPQQKRRSWHGFVWKMTAKAIANDENGNHILLRDMDKRSGEFREQIFTGERNEANLITTFAAESLKEVSSDGNASTGRNELKRSIVENYSNIAEDAKSASLSSHEGYRIRSNNLAKNFEDKLATADEYLGLISPSPIQGNWNTEDGKGQWINLYGQYLRECGNDGLNPKVFYSRFKMNIGGEIQDKIVVCPGFALKLKNDPAAKDQLAAEVAIATADYLALNEKGFHYNTSLEGDLNNMELDPKEREYQACQLSSERLQDCYPQTANSDASCNRSSQRMGPANRLGNELLEKYIESKQLSGPALREWMSQSLKGSCDRQIPATYSSNIRAALSCQTGLNFAGGCKADGTSDSEQIDSSNGLSCVSACLSSSCDGNPSLQQPSPRSDGSMQGGGTRVEAPATLAPGFSGRRSCFYPTNGTHASQAALPKGFRCPRNAHAGGCTLSDEPNCLVTWESHLSNSDKRGVSCYYNNSRTGIFPERINRNSELNNQLAVYTKNCLMRRRYIVDTGRGLELRTRGFSGQSDGSVGEQRDSNTNSSEQR